MQVIIRLGPLCIRAADTLFGVGDVSSGLIHFCIPLIRIHHILES